MSSRSEDKGRRGVRGDGAFQTKMELERLIVEAEGQHLGLFIGLPWWFTREIFSFERLGSVGANVPFAHEVKFTGAHRVSVVLPGWR